MIEFDQGEGLSFSDYRRLLRAVAQLRHSLRGSGRILLNAKAGRCRELAARLGFTRLSQGLNGEIWELKDAAA